MRIAIIGTGGVALNLALALSPYHEVSIVGKKLETAQQLIFGYLNLSALDWDNIGGSEFVFIAVQDAHIHEVASKLATLSFSELKGVAHTSGTTLLSTLSVLGDRVGVFYPLQTFSKERIVEWTQLPIFLESGSEDFMGVLEGLAKQLTQNVYQASSEQRKYIHLGAVITHNFSNFLLAAAHDILRSQGLTQAIYTPLLQEMLLKTQNIDPLTVQTGPAKRKDAVTLQQHQQLLSQEFPQYELLYRMLTDYIMEFSCEVKK